MGFDLVALAYDVLSNPEKRLAREGVFLKRFSSPEARILDLACATGVHAEFLARWGARVTACDLSEAMIEVARARRAHDRVNYRVGDMRTPPEGPFDLILCIGNSLNMLPGHDAVRDTLAAAAARLAPEGKLLLHVLNPESRALEQPSVSVKTGAVNGHAATVIKTMTPLASGRLAVGVTVVDEETGDLATDASLLLNLRQNELADMLTDAGLATQTWFGGLDGVEFVREGSPDAVVVATR